MEREAVNKGLVKNPVFPENIPIEGSKWGEPAPIKNEKPAVYTLVLEDVQERADGGWERNALGSSAVALGQLERLGRLRRQGSGVVPHAP